ncbi:MAG TPA: efflux RND transporter permease subunit [Usitatibacter sp.]|jgi:multidrug efflux pump|nr:efflux RND transporter permease subunit [Usitatibacter sp.]
MAKFFINRPIFAIVIAILVSLAGALAIFTMPVAQYPEIAPPSIQITANYAGASAQTVENTVIQVIEQQLSGLDHLLYISSNSDDSGTATLTVTFAPGTNPDIAQVQTQNKLQLATPLLPQSVQQAGVRVTKSSTGLLLAAGFISTDNSMSKYDISNYIYSHLFDPVSRLDGVGFASVYGTQYAMRIWLDLSKLNNYGLTPLDVSNAVTAQNVQVAGGQLGGTPAASGQSLTATITEATLLRTPEEFGNILLKVNTDGSQVRVRDVARVVRGAETYFIDSRYNGNLASGIAVQPAPGSNALKTAAAVRAKIEELRPSFPHGLEVVYPYDTTPFVSLSIHEVVKTLIEGVVLVFLVMYLFLQNLRATLIPTVAVPVVLLGTFGILAAAGFTINTLSMFGMVLAIGLLVDDAIVVVENVERVMSEEGLSPHDATVKAMGQISGALMGVAVVLAAVFVPAAFSPGSVGAIYRQFSLTIVSAMALSVFVALSLTPALCTLFLKPVDRDHPMKTRGFFGAFNRGFEAMRDRYMGAVGGVTRRYVRWLVVFGLLCVALAFLFLRLPTAFLPQEDQGVAYAIVQTPPGSTLEHTMGVLEDIGKYVRDQEGKAIDATFEVAGTNFAGRAQNQGLLFLHFRDWSQRTGAQLGAQAVLGRIGRHFASYPDALVVPVAPPAVPGLGTSSGFDFELEDRSGLGHDALVKARDQLIAAAHDDPILAVVRANGLADTATYKIDIDREKASALGVNLSDVDQTFSTAWGSKYVNNFLDTDARIKRVYVQADAPFRMNPEDLGQLYVRNAKGTMVQFSAFATGHWTWGSPKLERFNGVSSYEIQGQAAPGHSTGEAMAEMEKLMQKLPQFGYEWTGVSLQERQSGSQAKYIYALSLLVVFLALAALYESWSVPLSVVMVVPLGILGAVLAATGLKLENDVFFQVGLLTTIGLSAKNAILIVEFARDLEAAGRPALEAALEAAKIRLRPILMTSLAFVLGVLPLAIANGAGSASENAVGRGVIGGMLTATFLAPILVPMFFIVITEKLFGRRARKAARAGALPAPALPPAPEPGGAE